MRIQIPALTDRLHAGQLAIVNKAKRFNVIRCGRRFGKSMLGEQLAAETALQGHPAGWFAPAYKYLDEAMRDLSGMLAQVVTEFSKQDKRLFLRTGGVIDFWSLDGPDPGRSRAYKRVVVDEAGIAPGLLDIWQSSIRPTLTDMSGDAWLLGTPKGMGDFGALYERGERGEVDWASFQAPTTSNPYIDPDEVEAARRDLPPDVFAQEYEGIPAANAGNPFDQAALIACQLTEWREGIPVVWGVDLAKSQDWTVVCGMDAAGKVVALLRWQCDWKRTEDRLCDMIGSTPALIDSTGVGDPIVENLQRRCANVEGFKFTSQSKQQLMEGLAATIQRGEIGIPSGWLMNELMAFRYEYTAHGVRYAAPSGFTDDGVCALALAVRHRAQAARKPVFSFRMIDDEDTF